MQLDVISGAPSWRLRSDLVRAAITRTGCMLGPVTFYPDSDQPIQPYAVAPWAEENLPSEVPPVLRTLRGDWFCSAFGDNEKPCRGVKLPPHGETANCDWQFLELREDTHETHLRTRLDMPLQGGRCEATTTLRHGQPVIYQCHRFTGLTGPVSLGHHATLSCPDVEGSARISFSPHIHAATGPTPVESDETRGASALAYGREIRDLTAAPMKDGATSDLTRYPARRGFEDVVIVCADPSLPFAWSAVTVPSEGYVWFALRNPRQLASTILWFSNGGRRYEPWNGRHVDVLGVEDVTAYYHYGAAKSCMPNPLSRRGIATHLEPISGKLAIPYIQAVVKVPPLFEQVASIEPTSDGSAVELIAPSGDFVSVRCDLDHLGLCD